MSQVVDGPRRHQLGEEAEKDLEGAIRAALCYAAHKGSTTILAKLHLRDIYTREEIQCISYNDEREIADMAWREFSMTGPSTTLAHPSSIVAWIERWGPQLPVSFQKVAVAQLEELAKEKSRFA